MFMIHLYSQNSRYVPSNDADPQEMSGYFSNIFMCSMFFLFREISNRFAHFNGGMFFVPRTPKAPKVKQIHVTEYFTIT